MRIFFRIAFLGLVIFSIVTPQAQARIVTAEEEKHASAELEKHYNRRAEIFANYILNSPDIFNMNMYRPRVYRGPETILTVRASLDSLRTYFGQTKEATQQEEAYFEGVIKGSTAPDSYKDPFLAEYKKADSGAQKDIEAFFNNEWEIIKLWQRHLGLILRNSERLTTENDAYQFPGYDEVSKENDAIVARLGELFDKRAGLIIMFHRNMIGFSQKLQDLQKAREEQS